MSATTDLERQGESEHTAAINAQQRNQILKTNLISPRKLVSVGDKMNSTSSHAQIGTPAAKQGEVKGFISGSSWRDPRQATFKMCPKSVKLLRDDGKYAMWKPTKTNAAIGVVMEFRGARLMWMGDGGSSFGNHALPHTPAEALERFAWKDGRRGRFYKHEYVMFQSPNDRVEYRAVAAVKYTKRVDGRNCGTTIARLDEVKGGAGSGGTPVETPEYGYVVEKWVWWAGVVPIRVDDGLKESKHLYYDDYIYTYNPTNWVGFREFRNVALNTPPRAFTPAETEFRNIHNAIKEDIAAAVFHPARMMRMMEAYGEDWASKV